MIRITKTFGVEIAIALILASTPAQAAILREVAIEGRENFDIKDNNSSTSMFNSPPSKSNSLSTGGISGGSITEKIINLYLDAFRNDEALDEFIVLSNGFVLNLNRGQATKTKYDVNNLRNHTPIVENRFPGNFTSKDIELPEFSDDINDPNEELKSFFLTAKAVPEPITIFASAAALGFGALFKKRSQKA